ncbi:MAG: hypothetical protein FJ088_13085, partial [Deltaproteobacteria bacterium]|nr:hypothetical protein [Deltaproteobacteria bacterium]
MRLFINHDQMPHDSKHDINIEAARLQKFIADFAMDFIKCLTRTSVYTADHPAAAETAEEAYRKFKALTLNKDEIAFIISSYVDYNDIFIEGILSEPIKLF